MRIVPVLIAAIVLLSLPLIWLLVTSLTEDAGFDLGGGGSVVDDVARIEIVRANEKITALQGQIEALQDQIETLAAEQRAALAGAQAAPPPDITSGPTGEIGDYTQVVLIANRREVNQGINVASPGFLEEFLGRPREVLSDTCEPMTHPKLKEMLKVETVGPIRVQMLQPALDSLKRVFENVEATDPELYSRINTAGSLCVRQIRGTVGRTSTHSFGLAVDLNIDGKLDTLGDGKTQLGLTILADFFRVEGWVWGASFGREDSMHFEVSRQMLEQWRREGKI